VTECGTPRASVFPFLSRSSFGGKRSSSCMFDVAPRAVDPARCSISFIAVFPVSTAPRSPACAIAPVLSSLLLASPLLSWFNIVGILSFFFLPFLHLLCLEIQNQISLWFRLPSHVELRPTIFLLQFPYLLLSICHHLLLNTDQI